MRKKNLIGAAGLGIALSLGAMGSASAAEPLKVGVLATLEGNRAMWAVIA